MQFSVVIPTLNEEQNIKPQIKYLKKFAFSEIIVADGGSKDQTLPIAKKNGARVIESEAGRGTQLRAGARIAKGDILVFLHVDTLLPSNAIILITEFFMNSKNLIGTFKIRFFPRFFLLRFVEIFSQYDSFITKYGDQCIVIRRDFYNKIGGFPDWPLFEDIYLLREARKYTTISTLSGFVRSSSRRFQQNGVLRQLLWNVWLMLLYYLGYPPGKLAKLYLKRL